MKDFDNSVHKKNLLSDGDFQLLRQKAQQNILWFRKTIHDDEETRLKPHSDGWRDVQSHFKDKAFKYISGITEDVADMHNTLLNYSIQKAKEDQGARYMMTGDQVKGVLLLLNDYRRLHDDVAGYVNNRRKNTRAPFTEFEAAKGQYMLAQSSVLEFLAKRTDEKIRDGLVRDVIKDKSLRDMAMIVNRYFRPAGQGVRSAGGPDAGPE